MRSPLVALAVLASVVSPGLVSQASTVSQAADRPISIGAAVRLRALTSDPVYGQTLQTHFDMVTPENEMKWPTVHPAPGVYDFGPADSIVNYARFNLMKVRGHALLWYRVDPVWLPEDRSSLIALLREHILTVVSHFRGQVFQWDVVNEAIDEDGHLRDNAWLRGIGPDYIAMAFRFAREADPLARLFYNDFGGEAGGKKSDAIYRLVKNLRRHGVPVDGVGLQMHTSLDAPKPSALADNMRRLGRLGLEVAVTEMDVRLKLPASNEELQHQSRIYRSTLATCRAAPNCHTFGVWGFTDRYSWVTYAYPGFGAALPFDEEYGPKPAYVGMRSSAIDEPSPSIRRR